MAAVMKPDDSTRILVERARKGEREAFDALVGAQGAALREHAGKRIGRHLRSRVEVDDVVQETLGRAWKSIGGFRWTGEAAFLGWLKQISEHVILHLAARQGRDRILYREEDRGGEGPTPSRALRREERLERLEEALGRLDPDYREAVRLVRIEGLQIREAARRMDRKPKAVMHLVSRGLKKLRENFGDTESLHLPPGPIGGGRGNGES